MDRGKVVAIIPARGGSQRLPGKNTKLLAGKPLISWTIEAAVKSQSLSMIVVSSDDDEVLRIASEYPVKLLKRPDYLATASATTFDTMINCLDALKEEGYEFEEVMLLQPTSPLRISEDIENAIRLKSESGGSSVISVCECEHSPLWTNVLNEQGDMDNFVDRLLLNQRSQDLPTHYRLNGAIYIADVIKFRENLGFFMKNSRAYIMPQDRSVDIDTEIDFKLSQLMIEDDAKN